jgi:hypothetical protein
VCLIYSRAQCQPSMYGQLTFQLKLNGTDLQCYMKARLLKQSKSTVIPSRRLAVTIAVLTDKALFLYMALGEIRRELGCTLNLSKRPRPQRRTRHQVAIRQEEANIPSGRQISSLRISPKLGSLLGVTSQTSRFSSQVLLATTIFTNMQGTCFTI